MTTRMRFQNEEFSKLLTLIQTEFLQVLSKFILFSIYINIYALNKKIYNHQEYTYML